MGKNKNYDYSEGNAYDGRDQRKAKKHYYEEVVECQKDKPKKLWKTLKSLGSNKQSSNGSNISLNINEELVFDKSRVANEFNSFFTNI